MMEEVAELWGADVREEKIRDRVLTRLSTRRMIVRWRWRSILCWSWGWNMGGDHRKLLSQISRQVDGFKVKDVYQNPFEF